MPTDISKLRIVKIQKIVQETPSVKTIIFKDKNSSNAKPGQFLMVWIPRKEEIPLSIMISDKKGYAAITIRKYGYASSSLFDLNVNDDFGIRGPYGNSFSIKSKDNKIILIGGGTGMVPLLRLMHYLKHTDKEIFIIIGAKTKNELFFINEIRRILETKKFTINVVTEDGTEGTKGYPTDLLLEILSQKNDYDMIYTCGPELMMKKVYDISLKFNVDMEASIERYMKCGIGICSSCCINDQLVCIDGTVFNLKKLQKLSEFGISYRNKCGILQNY